MTQEADIVLTLKQIVMSAARADGLAVAAAEHLADVVVLQFCHEYGGDRPYVPKVARADRDAQILQDPRPADQVAKEVGCHPNTVRKVRRKRDPQGFGNPEWNL